MPSPCSPLRAPAEFQHQVADGFGDGHHAVDALLVLEADERADVEAADAGMAVVSGLGVVVPHHFLKTAHIIAQPVRINGGVLNVRQGLGIAVDAHQQAETGPPYGPHVGLLPGVGHVDRGVGETGTAHAGLEVLQLGAQLLLRFAVEFHQQQGVRLAFQKAHVPSKTQRLPATVKHHAVHKFDSRGVVFEDGNGGFAGAYQGPENGLRPDRA